MSSDEVKRIILDSLEGAGIPAPFAKLALVPLSQRGRALSDDAPSRWEELVCSSASAAKGATNYAPGVAAAVELCISALDVMDEIEDEDHSPLADQVGSARAINIGTALIALSQISLVEATSNRELPNPPGKFVEVLNRAMLTATVGQDNDLQSKDPREFSFDDALAIAQTKSGSLVAGATVLGAMLGTSDERLISLYSVFGRHFGAMAQIANDIHDSSEFKVKSDTVMEKLTLPRLFYRVTHPNHGSVSNDDLVNTGALHFGWVVFDIERRRCAEALESLRVHGQRVEHLYSMLGN